MELLQTENKGGDFLSQNWPNSDFSLSLPGTGSSLPEYLNAKEPLYAPRKRNSDAERSAFSA
jgi:hypothetical protein